MTAHTSTMPLSPVTIRHDALWGAKEISDFLGVTEKRVYALSRRREVPIRNKCGRLFAFKSELSLWLQADEF